MLSNIDFWIGASAGFVLGVIAGTVIATLILGALAGGKIADLEREVEDLRDRGVL